MKLNVFKRAAERKSDSKKDRRAGKIPAVLYVRGSAGENIAVGSSDFKALLRKVQSGRLSTTIFTLVDDAGKAKKAIIKEIQYNPINYDIIHLDFEELIDDVLVNIKVPIECIGVAECPGVKLGGNLRQVIRNIRVRCYPKHIPAVYNVDVRGLGIYESVRLKEIDISNDVRPLADLNEVVVVVAKR